MRKIVYNSPDHKKHVEGSESWKQPRVVQHSALDFGEPSSRLPGSTAVGALEGPSRICGEQRPDQIGEGRESIAKQIYQLLFKERNSHES